MQIDGQRILVLGGSGLVGTAICRAILERFEPEALIVTGRNQQKLDICLADLKAIGKKTKLESRTGNIFVRDSLKETPRSELLHNPQHRKQLLLDVLEPLDDTIFAASTFQQLIKETKPHIVIDSVNTATALAYQDVFSESRKLYKSLQEDDPESWREKAEILIASQYTPQLVRHAQIAWRSLTENSIGMYLKIGTTGVGGMGLNVPYTHSEDKPSRLIMSKSSMAGAHSMLLFLMGRSAQVDAEAKWQVDRKLKGPAPIIKELKPAAMIAWKAIKYGEIRKHGQPVELCDHDPDKALSIEALLQTDNTPWQKTGKTLQAPYIDTGENGLYARGEFEAISDEGQMEFITPEDIAEVAVREIVGASSGRDIVGAIDSAVLGPTYRGGLLYQRAIDELAKLEGEHGVPSIAFESLGPPAITKWLYELHLLSQHGNLFGDLPSAAELSQKCEQTIRDNAALRSHILSVRLAIVLRDGGILRGDDLAIPTAWEIPAGGLTTAQMNELADRGWVDLRERNMQRWLDRLAELRKEMQSEDQEKGSRYYRSKDHWQKVAEQKSLGAIVGYLLLKEEDGERLKY